MKEFTVEGSWWLPETPEARVPGALGFSPDSGASLDLLGSLKDPGDHFAAFGRELVEAGAVLGVSSKGKPVTLWNCLERRKDVNLGGFTKTSFSADVVVVGAHLGDAEEARFAKMSAEYRHLAEWAGISGFAVTMPADHAAHLMVIEHKRPARVEAHAAGARVALEVRATLRDTSGLVGEAAIRQRTWVSVEYQEGRSFGDLNGALHRFRNFRDRLEALYVLAVSTGMREGELLGLKWADVDLDGAAGSLRVRRTLTRRGAKVALGEPKTKKSRRTLRLTPRAVEALKRHRARQAGEKLKAGSLYEDQDLVFAGEGGGLVNPSNLRQRSFLPLLKRAGVAGITFHDLRHTCASLLFQRNVHPKFVQELLGHASVVITLDTYSHMLPGMGGEATDAMGDALG